MSDDLIASLASDLRPVRPGAMRNRLLLGLAAGVVVATLLMLVWLGLRPDLAATFGPAAKKAHQLSSSFACSCAVNPATWDAATVIVA